MPNNKYLICNFKAKMLKDELIAFEAKVHHLPQNNQLKLIICPPTPYLYIFQNNIYNLGSQEISMYGNGSYTGENSAEQLTSLNVKYVLVAHFESRTILKETVESITQKIKNAVNNDIIPIFFIGELNPNNQNSTYDIYKQITEIYDNLTNDEMAQTIIAYEPACSIGTGEILPLNILTDKINYIKNLLKTKYNLQIPLVYGGSINSQNIENISKIAQLDGIVLGESSTIYEQLEEIYKKYQKII